MVGRARAHQASYLVLNIHTLMSASKDSFNVSLKCEAKTNLAIQHSSPQNHFVHVVPQQDADQPGSALKLMDEGIPLLREAIQRGLHGRGSCGACDGSHHGLAQGA